METSEKKAEARKTQVDFIEAHSIRGLLQKVNRYNDKCPENPILKEDIVNVMKEEDTFIMLYYR